MSPFQHSILCTTAAALLLAGCSAPADSPASWWDNSKTSLANRAHFRRKWSAPRPAVPDTALHRFVCSLLAQRKKDLRLPDTSTSFWIGSTLFDRYPYFEFTDSTIGRRCGNCGSPELFGSLLRKLVLVDKLLSAADTVFIRRQQADEAGFELKQELLPSYSVVPVDTLQALIQKARRQSIRRQQIIPTAFLTLNDRYSADPKAHGAIFYLSQPLFSEDLQTVIISVNYTYGMDGAGTTYMLHREKRRWKVRLELGSWIS